jgi:hypothetical protein
MSRGLELHFTKDGLPVDPTPIAGTKNWVQGFGLAIWDLRYENLMRVGEKTLYKRGSHSRLQPSSYQRIRSRVLPVKTIFQQLTKVPPNSHLRFSIFYQIIAKILTGILISPPQ